MTVVLTILHIIFCFTLISVILLQAGRGQGLSGPAFGGGNVQSLFGTQAADFLTKATTVAAVCFLLTSIGLDWLEVRKSRSLFQGATQESMINVDDIKKAMENLEGEQGAEALLDSVAEVTDDAADAAVEAQEVALSEEPTTT